MIFDDVSSQEIFSIILPLTVNPGFLDSENLEKSMIFKIIFAGKI